MERMESFPNPTTPAIGTDPTRPTPGMCQCGCGTPTPRRYRPGHDAKHHSTLAAALTSGWRTAARAADLLADLGWTGYADRAALRAVPYRAANGIARQLVTEVEVWQVTPCGQHHSNRRCPALTAQARADGGLNRTTHLAADRWLTLTPATPELAARLISSWDQCTECTTDTDRLVDAERREAQIGSILERTPAKILKSSPTTWRIEADGPGPALIAWWNHSTGARGVGPELAPPTAAA